MSRTLYGLRQSPWTERACWALDHHGVAYRYHEHVPMIGELLLRRKARVKKASVPLLADGDVVVMGSLEIARHAERSGRGSPLFPDADAAAIERWADVAEKMTRAGRAWLLKRMAASRAAQAESLPAFIPGRARSVLAPTTQMALRFLARKHDVPGDAEGEVDGALRPLLEDVRGALGGRPYLLSTFTFADVAVASAVQAVRPRAGAPLGPATREAWTNEALARDFGDLLEWRDAVYAKHR